MIAPAKPTRRKIQQNPVVAPQSADELWDEYFASPIGTVEAIELLAACKSIGPSVDVDDEE